jgi:hypothetical protein
MTNERTSVAVAAEIETLRADYAKVTAAINLIGKPAVTKAEQIAKVIADAQERFASALADDLQEARNKRLSRFSDIWVDYTDGQTVLNTAFTIRYMQAVRRQHQWHRFEVVI